MKFLGFTIGKTKKIEEFYRNKHNQEIKESLETLVANHLMQISNDLKDREQKISVYEKEITDLKNEKIELIKNQKMLKNQIKTYTEQFYENNEKIHTELIEIVSPYVCDDKMFVITLLNMMNSDKTIKYARNFFDTFKSIDSLMSEIEPKSYSEQKTYPGLELARLVHKAAKNDINIIRAFSIYTYNELKNSDNESRKRIYDTITEMAMKENFKNAIEFYNKEEIHKDYVLNLSQLEKELINIKQTKYNNCSWDEMINKIQVSKGDTRAINFIEEPKYSLKSLKKLKEYELNNNVQLKIDYKDFQ